MVRAALQFLAAAMVSATAPSVAAANFDGPLVVVTRDTDAIGGPAEAHAVEWTRATGVTVKVLRLPFERLYAGVVLPILVGTDAHDALLVPSDWIGDLAPYLAPIPADLRASLDQADILPAYRDLGRIPSGDYVAVPIDGDMHIGVYRADLFADPGVRAAFAEETGRDLAPPETWDDYLRIARFFSDRVAPDGRRLRGTVEAFHPDGQRVWSVLSHVAAYAVSPETPASLFFDPDTMTPTIDSPAWVRGLKEYAATRDLCGPDPDQIRSADVRRLFVEGEAAMAIDWTDIGPLAFGPTSALSSGQVGFFALPGGTETWNPSRGAWDRRATVWKVPHLAFGGWVAAVPATSRHREEAWSFISWLASPTASRRDIVDGASGINPHRKSHLADFDNWLTVFPRDAASSYLGVIGEGLAAPNAAHDLRLPGATAYLNALDRQVERALTGESSVEVALRRAAADWDFLTDRLGRGTQRRFYRAAMGVAE